DGAGPIQYQRDFGDTSTLMLTVASPKATAADIELRASKLRETIESTRALASRGSQEQRASLVFCFPAREESRLLRIGATDFLDSLRSTGAGLDPILLEGAGCVGADINGSGADGRILGYLDGFLRDHYPKSQWEPDVWPPFVVGDPAETSAKL